MDTQRRTNEMQGFFHPRKVSFGERGEEVGVLDTTFSTWGFPKTGVALVLVESELPNLFAQRLRQEKGDAESCFDTFPCLCVSLNP